MTFSTSLRSALNEVTNSWTLASWVIELSSLTAFSRFYRKVQLSGHESERLVVGEGLRQIACDRSSLSGRRPASPEGRPKPGRAGRTARQSAGEGVGSSRLVPPARPVSRRGRGGPQRARPHVDATGVRRA